MIAANTLRRLLAFAFLLLSFLMVSLQAVAQTSPMPVPVPVLGKDDQSSLAARPPPPEPGDDPPVNNAVYIRQAVPTTMVTNGVYDASVTMQNYGTTTWYSSTGHGLGSQSPQDNGTWGMGRVPLNVGVPPGETVTFNFQVRAPGTAGTYAFQWRMLQEGVEWFGAATYPVTVTVREPLNNAEVTGQNIATEARTGQRQEVIVTMRNNGDTAWTRAQQYTLMAQNPHNNTTWGLSRVPLPVDTVNPGESASFRFDVTAPATAGQYASQWGMQREGYGSFGASTNNVIVNVTEPVNNAQPVSQTVLTQVEAGKSYTVAVTMVNNGETTWTRAQNYILMSRYPWNDMSWGLNRVALPFDPVSPGQTATFTFQITAPTTPGSYPFQWGMLREGVVVFGPGTNLEMVNVVAPPPATSDAQPIAMTVPPRMVAGKVYSVAVTMRNSGNTTWTPGVHTLGSANPYDNLTWGVSRVALAASVAPGQNYTFNFQVTAPAAGSYTMAWGVLSQTTWFGSLASSPVTVTENLGNVTFIHTDGLGSPVARTDAVGNLISRTRYEPYGYVASGATPTIGFTGHVNDADTGLTYMQQRYYDPVAGKFLSIDPVVTDAKTGNGFNRYAYATNNPFKYVDPDGRKIVVVGNKEFKEKVAIQIKQVKATAAGKENFDVAKKSKHVFTIRQGHGSSYATPKNEANAQTPGVGSSGTLIHDPTASPLVNTPSGQQPTPPAVVLGHEIAHVADYARGTLDRSVNPATGVKRSEESAMEQENRMRQEMGVPERTAY